MEKRRKTTTGNCFEDHVSKESKRKKMKPITEKLRRERINNSLEELKHLILSAMDEDVSHYAKMEKADILEMTVKYIKSLQKSSHQGKSHAQDESTQESNSNRTDTSHMDDLHGQPKTTSLNLVLPAISEPADFQSVTMETSPVNNRVTMDTANAANKPVLSSSSSELLANDKNMNVIAGMGFSPIGKKGNYLQCDRNDSRKALLSVREQNAMNSGYRKEYLSPNKVVTNHTQKVRLPGMECFIRNNFKRDVVFRETDKENATDFDFDQQYFAGWQMSPDDSQYSLPVWRPWGK